jgi:hypothetical protein
MVSGLPFDSETFAVLPPHFPPEISSTMTESHWLQLLPCYNNFPDSFKRVVPFLYASLIYHEEYLRKYLPPQHPILLSRALTSFSRESLDSLKLKVLTGVGFCPATSLKATGIPPHLALAVKVKALTNEIECVKNSINKIPDQIMEVENALPRRISTCVVEELRNNFDIEGVSPISRSEFQQSLSQMRNDIVSSFRGINPGIPTPEIEAQDESASVPLSETWWLTWYWNDGRVVHFVPQTWNFPTGCSPKAIWDLWYFGVRSEGIRPLRLVNRNCDIGGTSQMNYSRALKVIHFISDILSTHNILPPGKLVTQLTQGESDRYFQAAWKILLSMLYQKKKNRDDQLTYGTIYNTIGKYRKALAAASAGPNVAAAETDVAG